MRVKVPIVIPMKVTLRDPFDKGGRQVKGAYLYFIRRETLAEQGKVMAYYRRGPGSYPNDVKRLYIPTQNKVTKQIEWTVEHEFDLFPPVHDVEYMPDPPNVIRMNVQDGIDNDEEVDVVTIDDGAGAAGSNAPSSSVKHVAQPVVGTIGDAATPSTSVAQPSRAHLIDLKVPVNSGQPLKQEVHSADFPNVSVNGGALSPQDAHSANMSDLTAVSSTDGTLPAEEVHIADLRKEVKKTQGWTAIKEESIVGIGRVVEMDGETTYKVEKVLDVRFRMSGKQFKVKWVGWGEEFNSWEPEGHLEDCAMLIDFNKKRQNVIEKLFETSDNEMDASDSEGTA